MALHSLVCETRSLQLQQWENEDMFSKLPEVIIQHILSFLPMKDAVRTSILSKRWEYFWVSVPNLKFDIDSEEAGNFVDRALLLRDCTVQMFSLECYTDSIDDMFRLRRWVTAIVRRNVEELRFEFLGCDSLHWFEFPYCLFSCAFLTRLSLSMYWTLSCPPSVRLLSLRHLVLEYVFFRDESLDNLFTGCPMLETTSLLHCVFHFNIRISAPKLCKLEIDEDTGCDQYSTKVMISGPCLKSFHLTGEFICKYRLNDLPSLDEAVISIGNIRKHGWGGSMRRLDKVLKAISRVQKLSFSCGAIRALNYERRILPEVPFFSNLRILSFDHHEPVELDDCTGLMKILRNCPCLETLRFEGGVILPEDCEEEERILNPAPPCFVSCLKKLEILFDESYKNQKLLANAARILLKRASVLEKLIVYTQHARKYSPVHLVCKEEKLIKGLIELPTASEVCQIEFVDSKMKSI